jgi:hypothetical protein
MASDKFTVLQEDVKTVLNASLLIFKISVAELDETVYSTKINISGHNFYLNLSPASEIDEYQGNDEYHGLFLFFESDLLKISPIHVKAVFGIVSHSAVIDNYSKLFDNTFTVATGSGYPNFIKTSELENGAYVKDGYITITAKITVNQ